MLRVYFTNYNGRKDCYRTLRPQDQIDEGATHLFEEKDAQGRWYYRGRKLTGSGPWAAANYIRACHKNGHEITFLGTL